MAKHFEIPGKTLLLENIMDEVADAWNHEVEIQEVSERILEIIICHLEVNNPCSPPSSS